MKLGEIENKLLIRSNFINPISSRNIDFIRDGLLVIDINGKIEEFDDYKKIEGKYREYWIQDFRNKLIFPGFVDLHTHLPQYEAIGMDGLELLDWLNSYIFKTESRFVDEDYSKKIVNHFFDDLLSEGTTTAVIYSTIHREATELVFKKAIDCHINAIIGKVMMDQNAPECLLEKTDKSLEDSEYLCKKYNNCDEGRIKYAFTPRFAYNCSRGLMKEAGKLAKNNDAYVQTHIAENRRSIEATLGIFPECKTYTDIYNNAGLLGEKSILAHGIYLSDYEYRLFSETGSSIAHCPSSNLFLKSGIMDVRNVEKNGIKFGLGSDVGAGPNLSIFSEMHSAINSSKARYFMDENSTILTPEHTFYLATLGGAEALGLGEKIGNFEENKWADFVVFDFNRIDPTGRGIENRTLLEILSLMIYRGKRDVIERTYVRGKLAMGN